MPVTFQNTTWGQLKSALALRLSDSGNVYWSTAELAAYLTEALRTWSLLTAYWRDFGQTVTSSGTAFYDITSLVNSDGDTLIDYTVTDTAMCQLIQWHLLEPATGTSWTGSEQFTLVDVTAALQKRRDRFLIETGCVVTRTEGLLTGSPPVLRYTLPDTVALIRRLAFVNASTNEVTALWPTDISAQRNYGASYLLTAGLPTTFSTVSARQEEVVFGPPLAEPGTLDLIAIHTGAALDPTDGVVLGVPDDVTWAIKWGAMADLLGKDGPARDPVRAGFCDRKYKLAVELAKMMPVVINVNVNGIPVDPDTITNLDGYDPDWQSTLGPPTLVAAFPNMVALAPAPDDIYSVSVDLVRKAPIPVENSDFVQLGDELLDPLVDYAAHLAMFKMGGVEFEASFRGAQNFFDAAFVYNRQLSAMNPAAVALMQQSVADYKDRAMSLPGGLGTLVDNPLISTVNQQRGDGG